MLHKQVKMYHMMSRACLLQCSHRMFCWVPQLAVQKNGNRLDVSTPILSDLSPHGVLSTALACTHCRH